MRALSLLLALSVLACGESSDTPPPSDTGSLEGDVADARAQADAAAPPSDAATRADAVINPDAATGADATTRPDAATGMDAAAASDAVIAADATTRPDAAVGADAGAAAACPAGRLGARLGRRHMLIGGAMDDDSFAAHPFDIRYRYLAANVPAGGPCDHCAEGCFVDGASCANSAGCSWWGCWQYDQDPPGGYVRAHVESVAAAGALPMITYYIWFTVSGYQEGEGEIAAFQDGARVRAYLQDWRFTCQQVGEATAILHLEPDLWGYGQRVNVDPEAIPVALSAAGIEECAGLGDHMAGLSRCMITLARTHAPRALIGLHASPWAVGMGVFGAHVPEGYDVADDGRQAAAFLRALGADETDLVIMDMADRDAGFSGEWFDATDATQPSFERVILWGRAVGEALDLPHLWWQVPVGHMGLDDTCGRYRDNSVDYIFDHPERFAEAGCFGVAFGAGAECMTTPETDDGHFLERAGGYFERRPCLCGVCGD